MKNNWISARANFVGFSLPWFHLLLLHSLVILNKAVHNTGTSTSQYQRELKRPYPQGIAIVCLDPSVGSLENWLKGLVFVWSFFQCWEGGYHCRGALWGLATPYSNSGSVTCKPLDLRQVPWLFRASVWSSVKWEDVCNEAWDHVHKAKGV